jgi:hypothetical protein
VSWQTILSAVVGIVGLIRDFFAWKKDADARQAGKDSANADTLKKNQDAVADAMKAEIEADHRHKTMPGDQAFDQDFRRD